MASLLKIYKGLIVKYPLRAQAVQAGILMATGDQIAQNLIEKRKFEDLDLVRTCQFFAIGFCVSVSSKCQIKLLNLKNSRMLNSVDNFA